MRKRNPDYATHKELSEMTQAEMTRRILSMTGENLRLVSRMLADGYSDRGIVREAPVTLKQVNAVIQWESQRRAEAKRAAGA